MVWFAMVRYMVWFGLWYGIVCQGAFHVNAMQKVLKYFFYTKKFEVSC